MDREGPGKLPDWLVRQATPAYGPLQAEPIRPVCGTPVIGSVRAALDSMDPQTRALAEEMLTAPAVAESETYSPSGEVRLISAAKTTRHYLSHWILTDNFSIEWGNNLTNPDDTTPPEDLNGNGVPDVAERWADYYEYSLGKEIVAAPNIFRPPAFRRSGSSS